MAGDSGNNLIMANKVNNQSNVLRTTSTYKRNNTEPGACFLPEMLNQHLTSTTLFIWRQEMRTHYQNIPNLCICHLQLGNIFQSTMLPVMTHSLTNSSHQQERKGLFSSATTTLVQYLCTVGEEEHEHVSSQRNNKQLTVCRPGSCGVEVCATFLLTDFNFHYRMWLTMKITISKMGETWQFN